MEVSTFEILYKPLTPSLGAGTEAIARRVLQGYFLTVANLEAVDFRFRIEFKITLPQPDNPSRRLDANALFITDVAAPDNVFSTSLPRTPAGGNRYVTSFVVPAGKTALVVLLPNITVPNFFVATPSDIEVRGTVSLALPCVFKVQTNPFKITYGPQPGAPARVLLNAEHRATFLPPGWPVVASGDLDFDQTVVSVALARGRALNEIPQDAPCTFQLAGQTLADFGPQLSAAGALIEAAEPATTIIAALTRLAPDAANLEAMSKLLQEAGVPIRLEAAGRKGK